MRGYSASRSSNEDAAKTRATLGPPARRAAARSAASTGPSRADSTLPEALGPRATSCRRRAAPSREPRRPKAETIATTESRRPGGEPAIPWGPPRVSSTKGCRRKRLRVFRPRGPDERRSASVKDDRLDAINLLDLREQPLGHGGLRDDEAVWIIDDLGVVHDHLPNRYAGLGDDRRDPGQDSRLRCVRRDDLDRPPVHDRGDFAEVAHGTQGVKERPQLRILVDRVDGRGHHPPVDARGAGHRRVGELDVARIDAALMDAQAVHDRELGDLLLCRETFEIVTEARPHGLGRMYGRVP